MIARNRLTKSEVQRYSDFAEPKCEELENKPNWWLLAVVVAFLVGVVVSEWMR